MKVLIIKTSSLGDIIHTLPALTDAGKAIPGIKFDWVAEAPFAEIPTWHPLVENVIPIAIRRWRKTPLKTLFSKELREFKRNLRSTHYDLVIDAQGLIKSALVTKMTRGITCGLDKNSAREPLASKFYKRKFSVGRKQHAIERTRQLFANCLGYEVPTTEQDYGAVLPNTENETANPYILFLHGTTWVTKSWPIAYWQALAKQITDSGLEIRLPWGNEQEKEQANTIASVAPDKMHVLPRLKLNELAPFIKNAKAIVAADTGLGHLAAALSTPTISLYGPTDYNKTGAIGKSQHHIAADFPCAPCFQKECTYKKASSVKPACFETISPQKVWHLLQDL